MNEHSFLIIKGSESLSSINRVNKSIFDYIIVQLLQININYCFNLFGLM